MNNTAENEQSSNSDTPQYRGTIYIFAIIKFLVFFFQLKYNTNGKVLIASNWYYLKHQDYAGSIFSKHFASQHGNVLCLGSPIIFLRSWGAAC